MPSIVEIDEINGAGVRTHGVGNLNVGNIDAPNIVVTPTTAIRKDANGKAQSYIKYNQLHFVSIPEGVTVSNIRVWATVATASAATETAVTNLNTDQTTYNLHKKLHASGIEIPTANRLVWSSTIPTEEPVTGGQPTPNLGIGGVLNGTLTGSGYSDYFIWQVQISPTAPPSKIHQRQLMFAWDEDET